MANQAVKLSAIYSEWKLRAKKPYFDILTMFRVGLLRPPSCRSEPSEIQTTSVYLLSLGAPLQATREVALLDKPVVGQHPVGGGVGKGQVIVPNDLGYQFRHLKERDVFSQTCSGS